MQQQQRVLLAVTLSLMIWLGYVYFFMPKPQPVPVGEEQTLTTEAAALPDRGPVESVALEPDELSELAPTEEISEVEVRVETPWLRAVLSNRGGIIKAVALKSFQDGEGGALELLPLQPSRGYRFPGTLELTELDPQGEFLDGMYEVPDARDLDLETKPDRRELSFRRTSAGGLQVVKRFRFSPESYLIEMELELVNGSGQVVEASHRVFLGGDVIHEAPSSRMRRGVGSVALIDGERIVEQPKENEPFQRAGRVDWIALTDQYFLSALIPGSEGGLNYHLSQDERTGLEASLAEGALPLEPSRAIHREHRFFFGPKDADDLAAVGYRLDQVVDMGFFSFLARPLQTALKTIYIKVGNYGLAIILLTLGVRILLLPLTFVQLRSMKGMQAIQPKVAALKAQFKNNPKKLNEETMALYRQEGVNPFAGCLPMLVQLPVFLALYTVLLNTIGLRLAPFLWIPDLSQPSPVLVILMGISQFASQKLTPTGGDPKQAQIMMLMPIFFVVMFWRWPSGLVLYWFTSNMIQIVQQLVMTSRFKSSPKPAEA